MSTAEPTRPDFDDAARRYHRELHVYCYRMLGSFDDAEDHVQEVLLRAWRARDSWRGLASVRAWLYRIATNVCLDTLRSHQRRPLQPYPDVLLDELVSDQPGPESQAVTRESISLAYLAAIQLLPARQRAVLILRDVLGEPADEVAEQLDSSVPAVKSALQRARATMADHRAGATTAPSDDTERELVRRYVAAHEQADPEALIALLREDVRLTILPDVGEWRGKPDVAAALRSGMTSLGAWRVLPTRANGQPAVVGYVRRPDDTAFRPFVIGVFDLDGDRIVGMTAFEAAHLVPAFGLPDTL
ncbi:MAG TPA: sigma-70 family RNA polymerase sigma factor [Pseudonocardiaceae bacterium]|nr:sigma-70 family RNA polymerase sigma factor [Pseudonocardiaceae bacterium]